MLEPTAESSVADHSQVNDRPTTPLRAFVLSLAALGCGIGFIDWIESSQQSSLAGYLQAEITTVSTDRAARIEQVLVSEGDAVVVGQPLLILVDEGLQNAWNDKKHEVATLRAEWEQARAQAELELAWRMKQLDRDTLDTELKATQFLKEQYFHQVSEFAWQDVLRDDRALSSVGTEPEFFGSLVLDRPWPTEQRIDVMLKKEASRNASEVYATQIALCEDQLVELERLKTELPATIRQSMGVNVVESRLQRATEELRRLEQERDQLTVSASAYGIVGVFHRRVGDRVSPGEPIVQLLDEDRRFLTVPAPSSEIPRFAPGTEVAIRFPGGERRSGSVQSLPPQTDTPSSPQQSPSEREVLLTVRINPLGELWPTLPIGTAAEVVLAQ